MVPYFDTSVVGCWKKGSYPPPPASAYSHSHPAKRDTPVTSTFRRGLQANNTGPMHPITDDDDGYFSQSNVVLACYYTAARWRGMRVWLLSKWLGASRRSGCRQTTNHSNVRHHDHPIVASSTTHTVREKRSSAGGEGFPCISWSSMIQRQPGLLPTPIIIVPQEPD